MEPSLESRIGSEKMPLAETIARYVIQTYVALTLGGTGLNSTAQVLDLLARHERDLRPFIGSYGYWMACAVAGASTITAEIVVTYLAARGAGHMLQTWQRGERSNQESA